MLWYTAMGVIKPEMETSLLHLSWAAIARTQRYMVAEHMIASEWMHAVNGLELHITPRAHNKASNIESSVEYVCEGWE